MVWVDEVFRSKHCKGAGEKVEHMLAKNAFGGQLGEIVESPKRGGAWRMSPRGSPRRKDRRCCDWKHPYMGTQREISRDQLGPFLTYPFSHGCSLQSRCCSFPQLLQRGESLLTSYHNRNCKRNEGMGMLLRATVPSAAGEKVLCDSVKGPRSRSGNGAAL